MQLGMSGYGVAATIHVLAYAESIPARWIANRPNCRTDGDLKHLFWPTRSRPFPRPTAEVVQQDGEAIGPPQRFAGRHVVRGGSELHDECHGRGEHHGSALFRYQGGRLLTAPCRAPFTPWRCGRMGGEGGFDGGMGLPQLPVLYLVCWRSTNGAALQSAHHPAAPMCTVQPLTE